MSRKVVGIANRQRLDVEVTGPNGANRLLVYTGIAMLDQWFTIDNRLVRDEVDIILGPHGIGDPNVGDNFSGDPFAPVNAVASVALAAIGDLGDSDNVGWFVDEATVEERFVDSATKYLKIHVKIASQGEATLLGRLAYHADVLAIAAQEAVQLRSFVVAPDHLTAQTNVSLGTVTLDRPAPSSGIVIKITTKSHPPDIVSHPPQVTIEPGQLSATFHITLAPRDFNAHEVLVMASYGARALAAQLFVNKN